MEGPFNLAYFKEGSNLLGDLKARDSLGSKGFLTVYRPIPAVPWTKHHQEETAIEQIAACRLSGSAG
jgi:hypothetical protein